MRFHFTRAIQKNFTSGGDTLLTSMRSALFSVSLALAVALIPSAFAKGSGHVSTVRGSRPSRTAAKLKPQQPRSNHCTSCTRDADGRIQRRVSAKHRFERSNPCPSTGKTSGKCPGYVIDHVLPLKRGGADAPSNMQWQTKDAAKAKDKAE